MSKNREIRQLLFNCRQALAHASTGPTRTAPAAAENEDLIEQIDRTMKLLAGPKQKGVRIFPPSKREPPTAIAQVKVFPFSSEMSFNGLMFDCPHRFWDYLMEQTILRPAFDKVVKQQQYIQPQEIREFLERGGKIQKAADSKKAPTSSRSLVNAEELGL